MTTQLVLSNPDSLKLLQALELFIQTLGKPSTEVDLQATIGALAIVMDLMDKNFPIHQIVIDYQQLQRSGSWVKTADHSALENIVQKAKERLTQTEETLILLLRTYLQRVSSKLSAVEFVELTKAAIALLHTEQKLSLPEGKRLFYIALQTFGTQRSQPIPALGEKIPKPIARLVARLVRYQKIIRTDDIKAVLLTLASQTLENTAQRLTPDVVRNALKHNPIALAPTLNTQDGLEDLASALFFTLQLQTPSAKATQSEQEIAKQIEQAVAEFKARYRPAEDLMQPRRDSELSVSSSFFTSSNFETASKDFNWLSKSDTEETLKDETNS